MNQPENSKLIKDKKSKKIIYSLALLLVALIVVLLLREGKHQEQIETVNSTLEEIKAGDKPILYIFNKIDAFTYEEKDEDDLSERTTANYSLKEWENSWMGKHNTPSLFISAIKKTNIEDFRKELYERVKTIHAQRFPYNDYLYNSEWTEGIQ